MKDVAKIIKEEKDHYKSLLNNVPADLAIFDKEHRFEFVNDKAFPGQFFQEWVIGKTDYEYLELNNVPVHIAEQRRKHFNAALKQQKMIEFEEITEESDGKSKYFLRKYYPIVAEGEAGKEVEKIVGYTIDITELRHRELEMQKRAGMFRRLVNSMNQLVVIVHEDLTISFANKKWLDEIGVKSYQLTQYFIEGEKKFLDAFSLVVHDREPDTENNLKLIMENYKGNHLIMTYSIVPFFFTDTEPKTWAVFFTDVTTHIKIEEELKIVVEKEHKLNELKSSFVSLVSHELRTSLSVILCNTDLINQSADQQRLGEHPFTEKYTTRITNQIDIMTRMLNDFLVVGKIESRSIRSKPKQVSVRKILIKLFKEYYSPWKDGRTLQYSFKGDNKRVYIDPSQLKHVLTNLLDNAFKYSPDKKAPRVKVNLRTNSWSVLIADNGIGIPKEDTGKMFNAFIRGSNVGEIIGTGVGLMIVKYFLELNNGHIMLRSTAGKGSVFYIEFKNNNHPETV